MTPREIAGCLYFASRRKRREQVQDLYISAIGNSGDGKLLKKTLKDLSKE